MGPEASHTHSQGKRAWEQGPMALRLPASVPSCCASERRRGLCLPGEKETGSPAVGRTPGRAWWSLEGDRASGQEGQRWAGSLCPALAQDAKAHLHWTVEPISSSACLPQARGGTKTSPLIGTSQGTFLGPSRRASSICAELPTSSSSPLEAGRTCLRADGGSHEAGGWAPHRGPLEFPRLPHSLRSDPAGSVSLMT